MELKNEEQREKLRHFYKLLLVCGFSNICVDCSVISVFNCFSDTYFVEVESYCVGSTCLQQSGFQALVDSGASFTYLPNDIYDKVVLKVILLPLLWIKTMLTCYII